MTKLPIVVAGGGIGGACAAIALRQRGFDVIVLERESPLREVGAGLSLWVNATRVLGHLGLTELLERLAVPEPAGGIFDHRGRQLTSLGVAAFEERFGGVTVVVPRPDFLDGLWESCDAEIRQGVAVRGFEDRGDRVRVQTSTGEIVDAELLVGADGIGSVVRRELGYPCEKRYSGSVAFRGVMQLGDAGLDSGDGFWGLYLAPGIQAGITPMAGGRVYWFIGFNGASGGLQGPGEYREEVDALTKYWPETMQRITAATPSGATLRNDLDDLPLLKTWSRGRVTLLGDAAHATTPNLGQGACMAIEDAGVLAQQLARYDGDHAAALAGYDEARIRRCNRVTRSSRFFGHVLQLENSVLIGLRNFALARGSEKGFVKRLEWLLDYDPLG